MLCHLCTRSADRILYKYHELDQGSSKLSECSNPPRHRHLRMNTSASKVLIARGPEIASDKLGNCLARYEHSFWMNMPISGLLNSDSAAIRENIHRTLLFSLSSLIAPRTYHQRLRTTAPIFDSLFVAKCFVNPAPSLCVAERGKVDILLWELPRSRQKEK